MPQYTLENGTRQPLKASRLSLLYAVVFAEIGIATPFMPLWFASLGLNASVIGILLAIPIVTRVVATAPLTGLIDRGINARHLLLCGSCIVAACYASMTTAAAFGFVALAIVLALNAVAGASLVPTVDYLALASVRRNPQYDYARIRMSGSIAFLLVNLVGGALLTVAGERRAVPFLLTGIAGTAAIVAFTSQPFPREPARMQQAGAPLPPRLWLCMGAASAIQASHAALYGFASIYWASRGFSASVIGSLWALGVVSEIVLFRVASRFSDRWRNPYRLLLLGGTAAIVRAAGLYGFGNHLSLVILLQMLHGLTFGATQLGAMAAVSMLSPDDARGRAQGTMTAMVAATMACGSIISGLAYRAAGPMAFGLMAPVAGLGLCILAASRRFPESTGTSS